MSVQPDPHENLFIIQDKCMLTNKVTKYIKGNFLGKGGFARCYQFRKQDTKEVYAIKIIQKCNLTKPRSKQKLISEIKIHQSLKHPNIVEFKHTFEDNLNVYILLELCPNQTLNDLLKKKRRFSESELQFYMLQLLEALIYLHQNKIIHRDLKLGNMFLSEKMIIKLGDFGLASKIQYYGDKRKTICGTPNYIAPQILQSKGHSYEVDVWSLGVIMYTLTYGRPPFESKDVKQTYKKIKMNLYSFPDTIAASSSLKSLINNILQKEPTKRPSLKQIKEHQFFRAQPLSRQPSISTTLKPMNSSMNLHKVPSIKQPRELSDNGKLYTNNQLVKYIGEQDNNNSRSKQELKKDKSQQRFMNTQRNGSCFKTPIKNQNIQRVKSQRVFKELKPNQVQQIPPSSNQQISVKKWIDYSSKYGIGYLLSNKCYGVYFNDSTKIIVSGQENFYYIERIAKEDVPKKYNFNDFPFELKKKVGLFNHFKGYLKSEEDAKKKEKDNASSLLDIKNLIYIKRWFRSKHAVIFRMSNKTVQVIFVDQTQVIINSSAKTVIYFNKNHQRTDYTINEVMVSGNKQLIKRFQYTKEVLNEMAKAHQQKKEDEQDKRKRTEKKENKDKSLISNFQYRQDRVLQQRDVLSNTMQTPKKGVQQPRYVRFNQTTSIKRQ